MADTPAPAPDSYKPAVYAPPDHAGKPFEIVDSKKGQPWHLARHDKELFPTHQAAEGVFPMTRADFQKTGQANPAQDQPE